MSTLKTALVFVGGVAVGLVIAKLYARYEVNSSIHTALDTVGLGGGEVEKVVQGIVTPAVVG